MANTTHSVAYMGDAELIIMMRDGASDVAEVAFEALALRCEPAIRKRLKRLPRTLHEDYRQECRLSILRSVSTYRVEYRVPFGAYAADGLPSISRILRKATVEIAFDFDPAETIADPSVPMTAVDTRLDRQILIDAVMERLTASQRRYFHLRVEGLSQIGASQALGVSASAASQMEAKIRKVVSANGLRDLL